MYHAPPKSCPPPSLVEAVEASLPGAAWQPLTGGLTNRVWRVGDHVVKLYEPRFATPLFPNDPKAEEAALRALGPDGLAPRLIAHLEGAFGAALIYEFQPGPSGFHDLAGLATALHRVHRTAPPTGLRRLPGGSDAILAQTQDLMARLSKSYPALTGALRDLRSAPNVAAVDPVFIHSDPVAANVVQGAKGPILIDWQCPALGDPAEDLAMVLSPSMQSAYGVALPSDAAATFLAAYPDPDVVQRYRRLAPFHNLRMAAYAMWSLENGRVATDEGADLELDALRRAVP